MTEKTGTSFRNAYLSQRESEWKRLGLPCGSICIDGVPRHPVSFFPGLFLYEVMEGKSQRAASRAPGSA